MEEEVVDKLNRMIPECADEDQRIVLEALRKIIKDGEGRADNAARLARWAYAATLVATAIAFFVPSKLLEPNIADATSFVVLLLAAGLIFFSWAYAKEGREDFQESWRMWREKSLP